MTWQVWEVSSDILSFQKIALAVLGLHCCTQIFSSCGKWGLLSSPQGFFSEKPHGTRASHCSGFSCCSFRASE